MNITITDSTLTKTGSVVATFDGRTMKLLRAKHYDGASTRPAVRRGGILWTKLQRRANIYRYERLR